MSDDKYVRLPGRWLGSSLEHWQQCYKGRTYCPAFLFGYRKVSNFKSFRFFNIVESAIL